MKGCKWQPIGDICEQNKRKEEAIRKLSGNKRLQNKGTKEREVENAMTWLTRNKRPGWIRREKRAWWIKLIKTEKVKFIIAVVQFSSIFTPPG